MAACLPEPVTPTPRHHCWLPRSRRSPGDARRQLRRFLAQLDGGSRFSDTAELVLTELVTNAWQHGTRAGQRIWVGFEHDGTADLLYLAVEDASDAKPVPRPATGDREAGRGLLLVAELAREWGCGPRNGVGKRVWVVIAPG
ncbi:ATP-binding protein [Kitasatospora sp. LaBMicrA B282]|uniref:ATP-binding protein n=1 Tax=Kitasatospora sp. LaBMicrA B282 TaxID=3420949 RepID=UPI003D12BBA7